MNTTEIAVLLVEDDASVVRAIELFVKHYFPKAVIHKTDTVAGAAKIFDTEHIDAILLDGRLKDGEISFSFIDYLKEKGFSGPIIAISGDISKEMVERGCTHLAPKPDTAQLVIQILRKEP